MDRPKTTRSAKWGAACAPCAAAKTRCVRTQSFGTQQCDRCRSLEKDCVGQTSGPRKKRQIKTSAGRDISMAGPDDGLNNMVHSLRTPGRELPIAHGSSSNVSSVYLANDHAGSSISVEPQAQVTPSQREPALITPTENFTPDAPKGPPCTCTKTAGTDDLVPVESDETLLAIYRNQLSSQFPFVIIPADTTSRQLQASRPLLMKVIRMVASVRHLRLVKGQSRAVMENISQAILMRSERSLDLLQGILVFLGSYHYHCMAHAQFNNLVRLAISLVEDLELNTYPGSQQRRSQLPLARSEEPLSRTNEEKSALLGVWYMSSNAGLVTKPLAFTRYIKYMDQCLKDLDEARQYKTDQIAVQLIHIQRLTEKVIHFHNDDSVLDDQPSSTGPSAMERLEVFRVEFDSLRNALPLALKSNYFLSFYHNSAYLRLYAPLLAGSHLPDAEPQSFASLSLSGVSIQDVFSNFTAALKAWLQSWLAIPVCSYFYMPQPAYIQLVHGAMMLSRWVRVAGASAVKHGSVVSQNGFTVPLQPMPALSGMPPCPDLNLPRPPASQSAQMVSAQILNQVRARITAGNDLQIDVIGTLDTMGARFAAAKREMTAAQGVEWENDFWDFAAEHAKLKKARIEKWWEVIAKGRSPLADAHHSVREGSREAAGAIGERSVDDFGWATLGYDWDDMQWESALFDELLQDTHT